MSATDPTDTPEDRRPKCGHHDTPLTLISMAVGWRCPWCFPEFFPEHRFLVAFGDAERFLAAAGYEVVAAGTVAERDRLAAQLATLTKAIAARHVPEEQEAEVWWGDADHDQRFRDCPGGDFDCEGHVTTILVCSECGYTHDGETPIFRQWPCPTAAALAGSDSPSDDTTATEGTPDA